LIVEGSGTGYVRTVCEYVHLNPARARLLGAEQALRGYRWSSWPEYLKPPGQRPGWLRVDRVLGEMGIPKDRKGSQMEKAERVVEEELRRRGWTEATLGERAKGDREKVKVALRLRQETLETVAWIAQRLQMGSVANVNTLLYHWRQARTRK